MKTNSTYLQIIGLLIVCSTFTLLAQTDSSSTPKTYTGAAGAVIAYLICNSRKRHPIGGWLLYFYLQLYFGALFSFLILFGITQDFNPEAWDDKALYSLYLLSVIPSYLALVAELIVGSMLLSNRFRNAQTVNWLRIVFVVSIAFGIISLLIDYAHWPESVATDVLPLIFSVFWFFYFTRSTRVRLVLKERNWDPNYMYPPKTA